MLAFLLQSVDTVAAPVGIGAIALIVLGYYRVDRQKSEKRLAELATASEDRLAEISKDFRLIVQENTRALTALEGVISRSSH